MRLLAERLAILQECDLSEGQARAYLALLDYPAGTASSLAKVAELPRNRLYEILEELNALGLVDILIEEPRRYRARPISTFLDNVSAQLRGKLDRIESRRASLIEAFQPREQLTPNDHERGTTHAINGRRAVANEIERMLREVRHEIVLAGSNGGALRLAQHLTGSREIASRVAIEFYAPASSAAAGGWEPFLNAGLADVRWVDVSRATLTVVMDQEQLLRIHPVPDDNRTHSGQDFALLISNPPLIHDELVALRNLPRAVRIAPRLG